MIPKKSVSVGKEKESSISKIILVNIQQVHYLKPY